MCIRESSTDEARSNSSTRVTIRVFRCRLAAEVVVEVDIVVLVSHLSPMPEGKVSRIASVVCTPSFRRTFASMRRYIATALRGTSSGSSGRRSAVAHTRRVVYVNRADLTSSEYRNNKVSNTRYTPVTFLPANLIEQFSAPMNLYFLLIACLQLWRAITPVNPATTWAPLIFVFAVSAVKEAVDDMRRAAADAAANARQYSVVSLGGSESTGTPSQDIRVGDLVRVYDDEEVPCDLLLLKTGQVGGDGVAFVETANLDGETDLKTRRARPETQLLTDAELARLRGRLECEPPNAELYRFDAKLSLGMAAAAADSSSGALSGDVIVAAEQLLQHGTVVRRSGWVLGLVVYTGGDTKMAQCRTPPPTKVAAVNARLNSFALAIFVVQLCTVIAFGIAGHAWIGNANPSYTYLGWPQPHARAATDDPEAGVWAVTDAVPHSNVNIPPWRRRGDRTPVLSGGRHAAAWRGSGVGSNASSSSEAAPTIYLRESFGEGDDQVLSAPVVDNELGRRLRVVDDDALQERNPSRRLDEVDELLASGASAVAAEAPAGDAGSGSMFGLFARSVGGRRLASGGGAGSTRLRRAAANAAEAPTGSTEGTGESSARSQSQSGAPDEPHHAHSWVAALVLPLRFLLLSSMMVPISLKVTLDMVKLLYARLICADAALADPDTGEPAVVSASGISEDLGRVEIILTDKTGTLTENVMVLAALSIGGRLYDGSGNVNGDDVLKSTHAYNPQMTLRAAHEAAETSEAEYNSAGPAGEFSERDGDVVTLRLASPQHHGTETAVAAASSQDTRNAVPTTAVSDQDLISALAAGNQQVLDFLRVLALCNAVQPEHVNAVLLQPPPTIDPKLGFQSPATQMPPAVAASEEFVSSTSSADSASSASAAGTSGLHDVNSTNQLWGRSARQPSPYSDAHVQRGGLSIASRATEGTPTPPSTAQLARRRQSLRYTLIPDDDDDHVANTTGGDADMRSGVAAVSSVESPFASGATALTHGGDAVGPTASSVARMRRRCIQYASASPDDEALVHAAATLGVALTHRRHRPGGALRVTLAFDSDRIGGGVERTADGTALRVLQPQPPLSSTVPALAMPPLINTPTLKSTATSAVGSTIAESAPSDFPEAIGDGKRVWVSDACPTATYDILHVLEFTSERKRMSVVARRITSTRAMPPDGDGAVPARASVASGVSPGGGASSIAPTRTPFFAALLGAASNRLETDAAVRGSASNAPFASASTAQSSSGASVGSGRSWLDSGDLVLLTKGADDAVLPRLSRVADSRAAAVTDGTRAHLEELAQFGLRTLVVAARPLPPTEYAAWRAAWDAAHAEVGVGRTAAVAACCDALETGLTLLGATAIEDKLGAGVPEAIEDLRDAGIRFWMLTGDKYTTALQIARSARLLGSNGRSGARRREQRLRRSFAAAAAASYFDESMLSAAWRGAPKPGEVASVAAAATDAAATARRGAAILPPCFGLHRGTMEGRSPDDASIILGGSRDCAAAEDSTDTRALRERDIDAGLNDVVDEADEQVLLLTVRGHSATSVDAELADATRAIGLASPDATYLHKPENIGSSVVALLRDVVLLPWRSRPLFAALDACTMVILAAHATAIDILLPPMESRRRGQDTRHHQRPDHQQQRA